MLFPLVEAEILQEDAFWTHEETLAEFRLLIHFYRMTHMPQRGFPYVHQIQASL
jgi:hypothetical protein